MLGFLRRRIGQDDGFTLLESVIALAIGTVVFSALGAATISSVKAVVSGRTVQQAGDVGERALEDMRSLGYDAAAMQATDLTVNEPLAISGCSCFDPVNNLASGSGTEPLALDAAGSVSPHVSFQTLNGTVYTVRRYVTTPTDSSASPLKRLTVVVSWTTGTRSRTRILSSLITDQRSGLPLPDYKFAPQGATSACVSPGGRVVFGFTLQNNGARDSWSFTSSGGTASWNYYLDDGSGAYNDTDEPLSGSPPVTGPIEPTALKTIWAVASIDGGASLGTSTVTFRATSVAQPSYYQETAETLQVASPCTSLPSSTATPTTSPSASPSPTSSAPTQPTSCATGTVPSASPGSGSTSTSYYLNNTSSSTNTTATTPLAVTKLVAPTATTLWNYSTDLAASSAGRYVATAGTPLATTAEWRYQFGGSSKLVGTGVASLWGAPASGSSTDALAFTVTARRLSSTGSVISTLSTTTVGSGSWACAGFKAFGTSIPFGSGSGTTFGANEVLSLTVTVSGAPALLGFDTSSFPSQMILPIKSGG